jgi:peptidoglycan DL-endopeptidase CwlO
MSPDEDQLRAALREGEHDGALNADRIRYQAMADHAHRRRSIVNVAASVAAVVLVAGGGFGIAHLNGGSSSKSSAASAISSSAAAAAGSAAQSAAGDPAAQGSVNGGATEASSAAASSAAAVASASPSATAPVAIPTPSGAATDCPGAAPAVPAGGSGTAALFPANLIALTVCVYQVDGGAAAVKVFNGAAAQQIAAAFNASAGIGGRQACPADLGATVAMYPRTANGPAPAVIGNLGGCGTTSNGTAARQASAELNAVARQVLGH